MASSLNYNLPDFSIFHSEKKYDFRLWIPDQTYIVLGRSNNETNALFLEQVKQDKVPVLKRPSGGETVIISPRTIIISVKLPKTGELKAHDYFHLINGIIMNTLKNAGIEDIQPKGISDIAIGMKKILGSAIYKKPDKIFYHAVLNYHEDVNIFDRFLKHPAREPAYRKGRKHSDFVTSIAEAGYHIPILTIQKMLSDSLDNFIRKNS